MNVNNKNLCSSCFEEYSESQSTCKYCGYSNNEKEELTTSLPIGTMLMGHFAVGKVLGKGGFGVTYLAYDFKKECKVAIKEYMPDMLSYRTPGNSLVSSYLGEKEESFKVGAEKFYEEAKTVSKFNGHPNIINVYEFFYENNTAYFVMEYIEGLDLKKYLFQKGGSISEEECISLLTPIMDALIVIHSIGILHRDISPDNIYITKDGDVKLLDFGAARQVLGEKSKSLSVVLKPGFAPIEQYQTRGKQGQWTDVYALAATMYYSLTGQIPEAAMDRIEEDNIKPISELNAKVSNKFDKVLQKALSVKAINRYQTMGEFKHAIVNEEAILNNSVSHNNNESQIQAKIDLVVAPNYKFNWKKAVVPLIAAGIILICSVAVYGIWKNSQSNTVAVGNNGSTIATSSSTSSNKVNEAELTQTNASTNNDAGATTQSFGTDAAMTTDKNTDTKAEPASTTSTPSNSTKSQAKDSAKESQASEPTSSTTKTEASKATSAQTSSAPSKNAEATTATPSQTTTPSKAADEPINVENKEYTYETKKFSVNCTYTGKWEDSKPSGYGELKMTESVSPYWEAGDRLSGTFVNGLLNGEGSYTGVSGGSYKGGFKNGLKSGYGEFKFSDKSYYKGFFKDGEFNGEGIFVDNKGDRWAGKWENGEFKEYFDIDL